MISLDLARQLEDAGVLWVPGDGDRFMVPERDLDDVLFVVSHMVVEVDDSSIGRVLKFNGTTEWALDIVESGVALWLPREGQLRVMLGRPSWRWLRHQAGTSSWSITRGTSSVTRTSTSSARTPAPSCPCLVVLRPRRAEPVGPGGRCLTCCYRSGHPQEQRDCQQPDPEDEQGKVDQLDHAHIACGSGQGRGRRGIGQVRFGTVLVVIPAVVQSHTDSVAQVPSCGPPRRSRRTAACGIVSVGSGRGFETLASLAPQTSGP